jgi:hypothetical protein
MNLLNLVGIARACSKKNDDLETWHAPVQVNDDIERLSISKIIDTTYQMGEAGGRGKEDA